MASFSLQFEGGLQVNASVPGFGDQVVPLHGGANCRPPDFARHVVVRPRLEWSATPISMEDQQVVKQSHGESGEVMDVGVREVIGTLGGDAMVGKEGVVKQGSDGNSKPSFRDMLVGSSADAQKTIAIPDLDVDIQEEEVQFFTVNGTPAICFSDRLHAMVDAKLENSVIVRLLGRTISYNALLNQIRSLWNPRGEVALVDLENGYYLARFAVAEGVSKVLIGGPWVIYGNYLTVHHGAVISRLTWIIQIRLWFGLDYRGYFTGTIRRIDYNTKEGKRGCFARLVVVVDLNKPLVLGILIDGVYQRVEYEGLPMICYSCGCYGHDADGCVKVMEEEKAKHCVSMIGTSSAPPKDRFGPWMQAPSRRSRKVSDNKLASNPERSNHGQVKVAASRFTVLDLDVYDVEVREMEQVVGNVGTGDVLVEVSKSVSVEDGGSKGLQGVDNAHEDNLVAIKVHGSEKWVCCVDLARIRWRKWLEPIMLNADAHVAVRVVERRSELATKKGAGRQSITGLPEVTAKGNSQVGNLDRELESSGRGDKALSLGGDDHRLVEVDDVQWQENSSFDRSLQK
ncbi:hypothetical protein GQ457_04G019390 [Hibiscus cannabinus]